MKKTLTLIAICLTTSLFAQLENMTISNVITIEASDYLSETETLTIPVGKWWVLSVAEYSPTTTGFFVKFSGSSNFVSFPFYKTVNPTYDLQSTKFLFLTEGMEIYFFEPIPVQIWEYDAPSSHSGTLAYEEIEDTLNKGIQLFPNPTTSKIALNSDKDYEIEIFDMTGNKVMETIGNTIDLSVLSSAMYIVKTLDKMTKETNSYKVVKN